MRKAYFDFLLPVPCDARQPDLVPPMRVLAWVSDGKSDLPGFFSLYPLDPLTYRGITRNIFWSYYNPYKPDYDGGGYVPGVWTKEYGESGDDRYIVTVNKIEPDLSHDPYRYFIVSTGGSVYDPIDNTQIEQMSAWRPAHSMDVYVKDNIPEGSDARYKISRKFQILHRAPITSYLKIFFRVGTIINGSKMPYQYDLISNYTWSPTPGEKYGYPKGTHPRANIPDTDDEKEEFEDGVYFTPVIEVPPAAIQTGDSMEAWVEAVYSVIPGYTPEWSSVRSSLHLGLSRAGKAGFPGEFPEGWNRGPRRYYTPAHLYD